MHLDHIAVRSLVALSLALLGCSAASEEAGPSEGGEQEGAALASGAGELPLETAAGEDQTLVIPGANPGTGSGFASFGQEGECNGIDDDGNGIIDDVDVAGDGVCDCLAVGTLGPAGQWGEGDVFSTWLGARSSIGVVDITPGFDRAVLEPLQVIVVQNIQNRPLSEAEFEALVQWVDEGGGLMTMLGYSDMSEIDNVNALLGEFDMSYASQQVLFREGEPSVPITTWEEHPITDGIEAVGWDNGYPVEGAGVVVASANPWGAELALGRALDPTDERLGKVFVWGDEWITYDSEWTSLGDYQVERFWANSLKWLTPATECQVPVPPTVR